MFGMVMSVFYTFVVASLFTSILQIKPLYHKTPLLTQKTSKILSLFSPHNLIYMCGLQARHYFFFNIWYFYSLHLKPFWKIPNSSGEIQFLRRDLSWKTTRFGWLWLLLRHIWTISEKIALLKNGISLELLEIFLNSFRC